MLALTTLQCCIGHKNLENAVALYKKTYPGGSKDEFLSTFWPFYLRPDAPAYGRPWEEVVAEKNGQERVNAIRTRLLRTGRASGIEFSFNSKIGSTRDSHRLIWFAGQKYPDVQKQLLEEIFKDHFEHASDITSHVDLAKAAIAVGMPREVVSAFLESDEGGKEVDELAAQARRDGILHVPHVIIGGKSIEGAEDPSEFYQAFVDAKESS